MSNFESPIPLSEIETILAWVDGFKLSRPTRKISRDFSDAVLLAEILSVPYPKLVEMHNYPPRNSHSLKLNNWMTLNRKVLKKLKLNLCCSTMEQLANCAPGVIERVLVMEHVLVVPVKTRINGVLETVQQKVISYESYLALKEELKDAKDSSELLKQKVEHLDNLLKLKEERIDELQKQLDRKQLRRKEAEAMVNSLSVPFETVPSPTLVIPTLVSATPITNDNPLYSNKNEILFSNSNENNLNNDNIETINPIAKTATIKSFSIELVKSKFEESKIPIKLDSTVKTPSKTILTAAVVELEDNLERIKSDVFQDIEIDDDTCPRDGAEFKDSAQEIVTTIETTIQNEIKSISNPTEFTNLSS
ncbi:putative calponin-like and microtubule-associated protein [Operophtera brumata]|uniref:Putative calponin-like and microtubule-associated protein n=1 Tax=Operophtera brumata TaxID=104452 RepID=A0A0L7L9U7_OPEBR|nr:putative calponin-like and microtubule-associated protein [Operophtera brumata]